MAALTDGVVSYERGTPVAILAICRVKSDERDVVLALFEQQGGVNPLFARGGCQDPNAASYGLQGYPSDEKYPPRRNLQ